MADARSVASLASAIHPAYTNKREKLLYEKYRFLFLNVTIFKKH